MFQKEESKTLYALHIMRRDDNHITVIESSNYDEVYEVYNKLIENWTIAIKERSPFSLSAPVVTTFDPGLIYEITIRPVMPEQSISRYENPYQQKMMKHGFQNMFSSDLLDDGYR